VRRNVFELSYRAASSREALHGLGITVVTIILVGSATIHSLIRFGDNPFEYRADRLCLANRVSMWWGRTLLPRMMA